MPNFQWSDPLGGIESRRQASMARHQGTAPQPAPALGGGTTFWPLPEGDVPQQQSLGGAPRLPVQPGTDTIYGLEGVTTKPLGGGAEPGGGEMGGQDEAAFAQARQETLLKNIALKRDADEMSVQAQAAKEKRALLGEEIADLEKQKRSTRQALGQAVEDRTGSRRTPRYRSWVDGRVGKIDMQIRALRQQMAKSAVDVGALDRLAGLSQENYAMAEGSAEAAALGAVIEQRKQQAAEAQQMRARQEKESEMSLSRDLQRTKAAEDQTHQHYADRIDAHTSRFKRALEEEELTERDEKGKMVPSTKGKHQPRIKDLRSDLDREQEAYDKFRLGQGGGSAQGSASTDERAEYEKRAKAGRIKSTVPFGAWVQAYRKSQGRGQ